MKDQYLGSGRFREMFIQLSLSGCISKRLSWSGLQAWCSGHCLRKIHCLGARWVGGSVPQNYIPMQHRPGEDGSPLFSSQGEMGCSPQIIAGTFGDIFPLDEGELATELAELLIRGPYLRRNPYCRGTPLPAGPSPTS